MLCGYSSDRCLRRKFNKKKIKSYENRNARAASEGIAALLAVPFRAFPQESSTGDAGAFD